MFAEWLDKRLEALNWSNATLGDKVGVSTGAVWGWRANRYPPKIDNMPLIAEAFGISEFEVYCAVRGLNFEELSDGRLMQVLNLNPRDSERVIKLAARLMPVLLQYADEQAHAESPASGQSGTDRAVVAVRHEQRERSQEAWAAGVDGERRHQQGGQDSPVVLDAS